MITTLCHDGTGIGIERVWHWRTSQGSASSCGLMAFATGVVHSCNEFPRNRQHSKVPRSVKLCAEIWAGMIAFEGVGIPGSDLKLFINHGHFAMVMIPPPTDQQCLGHLALIPPEDVDDSTVSGVDDCMISGDDGNTIPEIDGNTIRFEQDVGNVDDEMGRRCAGIAS